MNVRECFIHKVTSRLKHKKQEFREYTNNILFINDQREYLY